MRFVHTKCGGEINVKKRLCTRCKKKWNPVAFRVDAFGIRPMVDSKGRLVPDKGKEGPLKDKSWHEQRTGDYAKWGDKVPGLAIFASRLPKWPRWARILSAVTFLVIVVGIIILVRGG